MKLLRTLSDWVMYLGMAISMYGGAQWPRPIWSLVIAGIIVIFLGIILRRKAGAPAFEAEMTPSTDSRRPARTETLIDALASLRHGIYELHTNSAHVDLDALKEAIEELLWIGPERIGSSQEAITAKVGFAAYAEVMAPLAASERWLNRAWSAAADGHRPECKASLAEALSSASEAETLGKQYFSGIG